MRVIVPRKSVTKVGLDYGAILGAVERAKGGAPYEPRRGEAYNYGILDSSAKIFETLPEFSPTGAPWVYWPYDHDFFKAGGGFGMDADGQWWSAAPKGSGYTFMRSREGDGAESPAEVMSRVTVDYVLPIVATVAGAAVGGVGGVVVAAAITGARSLAKGAALKDAAMGAARQVMDSDVAKTAFDKALSDGKAEGARYFGSVDWKALTNTARTAYETAEVVAKASYTQRATIDKLLASVPAEKRSVVEKALELGVPVIDVANKIAGPKASDWVDAEVDRQGEQWDKVARVTRGGAGSEGSDVSLGTVAAVGVGIGVLAWLLFL